MASEDIQDKEKIKEFISKNELPRLVRYRPRAGNDYWHQKSWQGHFRKFLVLFTNTSAVDYEVTRDTMIDACQTFGTTYDRGEVTCLEVDATVAELVRGLGHHLQIQASDLPLVMALEPDLDDGYNVKVSYKMESSFSKEAVVDFHKSYLDGSAPKHHSSEPVPEQAESVKGVHTIVGKTFAEKIDTEFKGKNVLLRISDSRIEALCWKGGIQGTVDCPSNFEEDYTAFENLVDQYSALKNKLFFAATDVFLNDYDHYAPDYSQLSIGVAQKAVAERGPVYILIGADRDTAKVFDGIISEAEQVSTFFKDAGLVASDDDVMDEL